MNNLIKFTNTFGVPEEYKPQPSSKFIPDWYKNLESYMGAEKKPDGQAFTTSTAKRCMPIFDAIDFGYIISTHSDIWVSQKLDEDGEYQQHYEWASFNAIEFHPKKQLNL